MRREVVIGRWAPLVGLMLAASACTGQCGTTTKTPVKTTPLAAVPSASPTPTAPLQASSSPFHGGEVGVAYEAVSLSASGGAAPYTWSMSAGALPGGLTLGPNGSVSGTPSSAGSFSFTIQVADKGSSTASVPGTIVIAPALTAGLIPSCAQYCNVELGCVSVCGAFGQQSGGAGPYTYTLTQGPLPAGTSLNGLSLAGTFKGNSGWLQFTVQVGDAYGATASVSPKFWMYDHISWSGTYLCNGSYVAPCQVQIQFAGGVPGGQPLVTLASVGPYCPPNFATCPPTPANAPGGMTATSTAIAANGGGTVTVTVAAHCGGSPPGCPNGYEGAIGLVVVDQALCGNNARCQTGVATVDVYMVAG